MPGKFSDKSLQRFFRGGFSDLCLKNALSKKQIAGQIASRFEPFKSVKCFLESRSVANFEAANCPIEQSILLLKIRLFGQIAEKIPCRTNIALLMQNFCESIMYPILLGIREIRRALKEGRELFSRVIQVT